jgi:hypothetical protein
MAAWMNDEKQARPAVKEKIILRSKERPNRVRTASYLVRLSLFGQIQRFAALQQSQGQPGRPGLLFGLFVAFEKLSDFKFVAIKFERIASRI